MYGRLFFFVFLFLFFSIKKIYIILMYTVLKYIFFKGLVKASLVSCSKPENSTQYHLHTPEIPVLLLFSVYILEIFGCFFIRNPWHNSYSISFLKAWQKKHCKFFGFFFMTVDSLMKLDILIFLLWHVKMTFYSLLCQQKINKNFELSFIQCSDVSFGNECRLV